MEDSKMNTKKKKFKIKIGLNNGIVREYLCNKFDVFKNSITGSLTQVTWEDISPRIMHLNINNIDFIEAEDNE